MAERTLLYTSDSTVGAPYQTDVELLDNLSKYDVIEIWTGTTNDNGNSANKYCCCSHWHDVQDILTSVGTYYVHLQDYEQRYGWISFTDTTFNIVQRNSGRSPSGDWYIFGLFKIYGYKF